MRDRRLWCHIRHTDMEDKAAAATAASAEEAAARAWWGQREARAEAEVAGALQRRMEAQRAQIHAFKTEQSKWEHELQVRPAIPAGAVERTLELTG